MRYLSRNLLPEGCDICTYAICNLTTKFIEQLKTRKQLFEAARNKDNGLSYMEFWDTTPKFYNALPPDLEHLLEDETIDAVLEKKSLPKIEQNPQNVMAVLLVIDSSGFYWTCYPRHLNLQVETGQVRWDMLFDLLENEEDIYE